MWHIDENGNAFKDDGKKMFIKTLYRVIYEDDTATIGDTVHFLTRTVLLSIFSLLLIP